MLSIYPFSSVVLLGVAGSSPILPSAKKKKCIFGFSGIVVACSEKQYSFRIKMPRVNCCLL